MKNRKATSSSHDNISVKRLESEIVKSYTDLRLKRRNTANSFLQKSAQILQSYNQFFQKPQHLGDANTYFKQSLRNYDQFDLKSFQIERLAARNKSSEYVSRERKPRSNYLTNPKVPSKVSKEEKEKSKEQSYQVENIFDQTPEDKGDSDKMAEEDMGEYLSEVEDGDPFVGVDELVDQVDTELDQVRHEMESDDEHHDMVVIMPSDDEGEEEADLGEEEEDVFNKLEQVVKETQEPLTSAPPAAEEAPPPMAGGDMTTEESVLKEVEECERQCMEIYTILNELKCRVTELLSKAERTPEEEQELAEKQLKLNEKMQQLEQKTMLIESLLSQAKKSEREQFNRKHSEDALPKVIICGMTEENVPKLIICDDKKRRKKSEGERRESKGIPCVPRDMGVMPQIAKKLSDSYNMQEKLAAENADLEGMRYKLQEDLLCKDQTVESLQRKLCGLQCEMRMVVKENTMLHEKLQVINSVPCGRGDTGDSLKKGRRMPCGKGRGPCPAEMEQRLQEYSDTTQQLEKQLGDMESEVRNMQNELVAVQKERLHLEQHRRMLCQPPCAPPVCPPPSPCGQSPPCPAPCGRPSPEQQLRELREKFNCLQDDYKGKLTEVAGLRADVEQLRKTTQAAEDAKKALQERVNEAEKELRALKNSSDKMRGSKEMLVELEQQLNVAKQRYREAKDELEEVRALVEDQQGQLDDYRNKYLQAQQQVEEQRRQIDMMELENNRINEQVNLEIQRVKNQFQEKLQELTPLPDILKATQIKLQEAQQMHLLAERNNEGLVRELQAYRDKAAQMADQMEKVRSDQELGAGERANLQSRVAEWEAKYNQLVDENEKLHIEITKLEGTLEDCEKRCQEKAHEIAQLSAEVDNVREESARQVARTKDRCETVRRSMQNQIADLERQLAQSRAAARAAQKDRDEIRQKMQSQINNLNENFEDAQMRIRNLQGHVNFLKNSYTNVFPADMQDNVDPCNCANNF